MVFYGKLIKNNRIIKNLTVEPDGDTRTHRIFSAMDLLCRAWDLERPIWLDKNIDEFKRLARTRFYGDSFIEEVEFDYMEVCILEE